MGSGRKEELDAGVSFCVYTAMAHGILKSPRRFLSTFTLLLALILLALSPSELSAQVPPGCSGASLEVNLSFFASSNSPIVQSSVMTHLGDAIYFEPQVGIPSGACSATNVTGRITFPDGTHLDFLTNSTVNSGETITCPGDPRCVLTTNRPSHIFRQSEVGTQTKELNLPNVFCFSPSNANVAYVVATASGISQSDANGTPVSGCIVVPVTFINAALFCELSCSNGVGTNGPINFNGFVNSVGNSPVTNVVISNFAGGNFTLVTNVSTLSPGQTLNFAYTYNPTNPTIPTTNTVYVSGTDLLGSVVGSTCSAICSNLISPYNAGKPAARPRTVKGAFDFELARRKRFFDTGAKQL